MTQNVRRFQQKIIRWYQENKRNLPWRRTGDPYHILVSEIMLQQTQVDRVIPKYEEFLLRFPTIHELAQAPLSEILRLWSGLGYNRRAKYLLDLAKTVVSKYDGHLPKSVEKLRTLSGIGEYTASAIMCFVFKQKSPAVDTNVRNVLEQEFNGGRSLLMKKAQHMLLTVMPDQDPDTFLHALMDYSALALKRPVRKQSGLPSVPFPKTNRFLRGQIVKLLVAKSGTRRTIVDNIAISTKRSSQDVEKALTQLLSEQFCTQEGNLVTLVR